MKIQTDLNTVQIQTGKMKIEKKEKLKEVVKYLLERQLKN